MEQTINNKTQTMRNLLTILSLFLCSILYSQDFGYVTYKKYIKNGKEKQCNIIFMFNINEKGDVISVDEQLTPVHLKATTSYSVDEGIVRFNVIDEDGTEYYVTLSNEQLVMDDKVTKIVFLK